jgi:isopenicillin N synthase-like dioxygenase
MTKQVDVSSLFDDNPNSNNHIYIEIRDALQNRGYFYAQNVPSLSKEYIRSTYAYADKLHQLPIEVKQEYSQRDGHGAYSGLDIGQAELAYDPSSVATVRAWDYSRTRFTLKRNDDPSKNRYPGKDVISPQYVDVLDELYERQNELGRVLMTAFAKCLDLPSETFANMFDGENGDFGTIRLLRYPDNESTDQDAIQKANVGISAHTDFEAFTLMHQDAPGLQFMPPDGSKDWIDAPVHDDMFVVIVGDVLERFTNGVLKATPHRVIKTRHERNSIIRFNAVSSDTLIKPLPEFVSKDRPAMYTPVTMKTHMETTMRNLEKGIGAWDSEKNQSLTANYVY